MNLLSSPVVYIKIAVAVASMFGSYYVGTKHGYSSRQSEMDAVALELSQSKEEYGKLVREYQDASLRLQAASRALADSAAATTEKEVVMVEKAITKYKDRVVLEERSCILSKPAVDFINSLGE